MQTPINKAAKEIAELWSSPSDEPTYTQIFEVLERNKPYEQECIENAYIECWMNDGGNGITKVKEANEYFTQTFNTTPIVFDAKKVAEEMINSFLFADIYFTAKDGNKLNAIECSKVALTYSRFTQSQQAAIINELNKI